MAGYLLSHPAYPATSIAACCRLSEEWRAKGFCQVKKNEKSKRNSEVGG